VVDCPNCRNPMTAQAVEAYAGVARPIEVGSCAGCGLFWFDESASVRLTPKSVLGLFQYIGQAGSAKNSLASSFSCPRCRHTLAFTHDLQRATHFTYWRCPGDHGQLITFGQFLAEKNFIRPPSSDELAKLRATVRQLNCSQCGAPIDLATDTACPHCGAAITLIDADGVAKALHDLVSGGTLPAGQPAAPTTSALGEAQLNALFDQEHMREHEGGHDLLAIGAAAIGALVDGWLLLR
jgi:endogenous inhibitor of DNA gyrase (YacG/DUF329 family)